VQCAVVDSNRVFACSVDTRSLAEVGASPISVLIVCVSWSSCCRAEFPFFSICRFSSCRGPPCASVFIPALPVRYSSASILPPPITPGLARVCTILFLSHLSSLAQNLLHDLVSLSPKFTGPELAPSLVPLGASRSFRSPVLTSGARPRSFSVGLGQTSVSHQHFDVLSSEILIFDRVCGLLQKLIPVLFFIHRIKRIEVP
jgi:hypothetical protein